MRSGVYNRNGSWTVPGGGLGLYGLSYKPSAVLRNVPNSPLDYQLFLLVVILSSIGLIAVYTSTYHLGLEYLRRHIIRLGIGALLLWLGMKLNLQRLGTRKIQWLLLILSIGLMVGAIIYGNIGGEVARRRLGVFQPQEFVKYALVIWLAGYFEQLHETGARQTFLNTIVKPGLVVAIIVGTVLAQPAVGTSVILGTASFMVFVLAGVRWRYLLTVLALAGVLVGTGFGIMPVLKNTKFRYIPERWERFISGDRYHQHQALIALGSGGPVGKGLGEGRQKYYFLPKLHKDFIFCAIGEESGFLGCGLIMLFYFLLALRMFRIGERSASEFGRLLSGGVGVLITVYALVHIAVSLDIVPCTGQPLPFISYGGSALTANMFAIGLVLNVSRHRRSGLDEEDINGRGWNRWSHFPRSGIG
ncbi:MAG: FtsW/RodA/SpoVE family cell cycle protein [candidate division WOR-3 bacterium]|jgi:cell division protein FtsW